MTRGPKTFHSLLLLAGVFALGGFQCPRTAPPVPPGVQCKQGNDGSNQTQTMSWGSDSLALTIPTKGDPPSSVLTLRGETLYTITVATGGSTGRRTVTTRFGKAVSGARELVLSTADDETFAGTLDGKQLKPFPKKANPEAFADGSPLPALSIDKDTENELKAFAKAVHDAPDACKSQSAALNRPLFADAVPGHTYDRYLQGTCAACWQACIAHGFACMSLTISTCSTIPGDPYGITNALCAAFGTKVCIVTAYSCDAACGVFPFNELPNSPCCPKSCGDFRGCCPSGEICGGGTSDDRFEQCCPADHPRPCGSVCCGASDLCSSSGTCLPCHQHPVSWNSDQTGGCGIPNAGQCNKNTCWQVPGVCDSGSANGIDIASLKFQGQCMGQPMATGPTEVANNGGQVTVFFDKLQDACYVAPCTGAGTAQSSALNISFNVNCCP